MAHGGNHRQHIGKLGEDIAVRYLQQKRFSIVERNYRRKWGEIDVIAQRKGRLHFVEVKSVTRESIDGISRGTTDGYRPEENVHPWKLKRLSRAIQTYLAEHREERGWSFDVAVVFLDMENRRAKVRYLEDIVL